MSSDTIPTDEIFKITERLKDDLQTLFELKEDQIAKFPKVYNEHGVSTSDSDIADALGIGITDAGICNGIFVNMGHFVLAHGVKTPDLAAAFEKLGFESQKVNAFLATYSALDQRGKDAVRLLAASMGIPRLAPHWEGISYGVDYRPFREDTKDAKFAGMVPMVLLKLGVSDTDTEETKTLIFEMSILEYRSFVRALQAIDKAAMKDWEEMRKRVGENLIG